jgi:hypothetical protein
MTDAYITQNNCMEHSPSSEAKVSSGSPEIPRFLWNPVESLPRSQEPAECT